MAKSPKASDINTDAVRKLADLLNETGLTEIEYETDDWSIRVAKGGGTAVVQSPIAVHAAPAAGTPSPAPEAIDLAGAVTSPMVGVVYLSPDPDSPNFVSEGDDVKEGQTLALVEAMKVFNQINAPRAGKVKKVLVTSGTPVEFGEPMFVLE